MFCIPLFDAENFPSLRSGRSSCLRLSMELFDTINEFNSLQFFTAFRHSSVSALSEAISANKLLVKGASNTPSKLLNRFPETFNTRIVSQHLLKGSKPFDSNRLFERFNHFNCFKCFRFSMLLIALSLKSKRNRFGNWTAAFVDNAMAVNDLPFKSQTATASDEETLCTLRRIVCSFKARPIICLM